MANNSGRYKVFANAVALFGPSGSGQNLNDDLQQKIGNDLDTLIGATPGDGVFSGWQVSQGGGLVVSITPGSGLAGGQHCKSTGSGGVSSLPAATSGIKIYVTAATPWDTATSTWPTNFGFTTGALITGQLLLATVTTDGSGVTVVVDGRQFIQTQAAIATTIDDTVVAAAAATSIQQRLGMLANRLKVIVGGADWKAAVPASLTSLVASFLAHAHSGGDGPKLTQANTHESPDTDGSTTALHHTIGAGANQAAAGNHTHAGSTISNIPAGGIAAANVQAALNELDTDKSPTTHTHWTGTPASDLVFRVPTGGGAPDFGTIKYAAIQAVSAAARLLGRRSASAGAVEELSLGAGLALSGTTLSAGGNPAATYNFTFNSIMDLWGSGTNNAPPTGWTLTGAGATVARNTTAGQFRFGEASVALTRVNNDCRLSQDVLVIYPTAAWWGGKTVAAGCWVRATVASRARIALFDGTTTTFSSYHSGGSGWEFLSVSATLQATPTAVQIRLYVDTGNTTVQFDGTILVVGAAVSEWVPDGWVARKTTLLFTSGGNYANIGFYGPAYGYSIEDQALVPPPYRGVARNLRIRASASSTDTTDNLRKNKANTSLFATFLGFDASDTTHDVLFTVTDQMSMGSNESSSKFHHAYLEYFEVPEGI